MKCDGFDSPTIVCIQHCISIIFFKDAVKLIGQTIQEPFSFILSSREDNQVEVGYAQHLENFLQLRVEHNISLDVLSRYIASSILMDAYPPDMHSKLCIPTPYTSLTIPHRI